MSDFRLLLRSVCECPGVSTLAFWKGRTIRQTQLLDAVEPHTVVSVNDEKSPKYVIIVVVIIKFFLLIHVDARNDVNNGDRTAIIVITNYVSYS